MPTVISVENLSKSYRLLKSDKFRICLILILGLGLRLYGIQYGLPFRYDPDEPTFVTTAGAILANRDLNPHWFGHPGTTTIYSLVCAYGLIFIVGLLTGKFENPEQFRALYHTDPTLAHLSGRLLMAIFGVASILLLILIVRRISNQNISLLAGFFLAIDPLSIHFSKFIRTDTQATFWILIAFWFCLNILEEDNWKSYLLAGLFSGIALATKYPAILISITIPLAHWLRERQPFRKFFKLLASGGAVLAGAFISSPFLFIDYRTALQDILVEARPTHLSATGSGFFNNLYWYLKEPLLNSLSLLGLTLALLGIVLFIVNRQPKQWLLAAFPIVFLVAISNLNLHWDRWVIPVIPFLCVALACTLGKFYVWLIMRLTPRHSAFLFLLFLASLIIPTSWKAVSNGRMLAAPETRTIAGNWIINNIPPGSRVLSEVYTPQLPVDLYQFYFVNSQGDIIKYDSKDAYKSLFMPRGHLGKLKHLEELQQSKIQFIIASHMYDRYLAEEKHYPEIVATYRNLFNAGRLLYEELAVLNQNVGPHIRVYQLITP